MNYDVVNFHKVRKFSLFNFYCCYLDVDLDYAMSLFESHNIKVTELAVYKKSDSEYCLMLCKFRKKDFSAFKEAMLDLTKKMALTNHMDYDKTCDSFSELMQEFINMRNAK